MPLCCTLHGGKAEHKCLMVNFFLSNYKLSSFIFDLFLSRPGVRHTVRIWCWVIMSFYVFALFGRSPVFPGTNVYDMHVCEYWCLNSGILSSDSKKQKQKYSEGEKDTKVKKNEEIIVVILCFHTLFHRRPDFLAIPNHIFRFVLTVAALQFSFLFQRFLCRICCYRRMFSEYMSWAMFFFVVYTHFHAAIFCFCEANSGHIFESFPTSNKSVQLENYVRIGHERLHPISGEVWM